MIKVGMDPVPETYPDADEHRAMLARHGKSVSVAVSELSEELDSAVIGGGSSTQISALDARVTQNEQDISSNDSEILQLQTDVNALDSLISPLGSGYVLQDEHYQVDATGGVARALDDRLGEVFNVKDFGATGDGSTDDTTEIQLALTRAAAAAPAVVYLPPATYVTSAALSVGTGVTISGYGAKLFLANGSNAIVIQATSGADDISVLGLTIDGNKANQSSPLSGIQFSDSAGPSLRHRIQDCRIENTSGAGVLFNGCKEVKILNNFISGTGNEGVDIKGEIENVTISGNHVRDTDQGGISLNGTGYWVEISGNVCDNNGPSGDNITGYGESNRHVIVSGNVCRDSQNHGIHIGGEALVVSNNTILNPANHGIYLAHNNDGYSLIDAFTITGNTVNDAGLAGVMIRNARAGTISGNSVQGSTNQGMNLQDLQDCTINGNAVYNNGEKGIRLAGCIDSAITGNVCTENVGSGIELLDSTLAGCSDNVVSGNLTKDNGARGIAAFGSEANNFIHSNVSKGNTLNNVLATNANTNATGNFDYRTALQTLAAAASVTLPSDADRLNVTDASGPTTINTIAASWVGRQITLCFAVSADTVVASGVGNIELLAPFSATDGQRDTLTLVYNGTDWLEVSRSAAKPDSVNVLDFGAVPLYDSAGVPSGTTTDNGPIIEQAIQYAIDNHLVLEFPAKEHFWIESTITVYVGQDESDTSENNISYRDSVVIRGNSSTLRCGSSGINGPMIEFLGKNTVSEIENAASGAAISFTDLTVDSLIIDMASVTAQTGLYAMRLGSANGPLRGPWRHMFRDIQITGRSYNTYTQPAIIIDHARNITFDSLSCVTGGVRLIAEGSLEATFTGDIWFNNCDLRGGAQDNAVTNSNTASRIPDRAFEIVAIGDDVQSLPSTAKTAKVHAVYFNSCQLYAACGLIRADRTGSVQNVHFDNCEFDWSGSTAPFVRHHIVETSGTVYEGMIKNIRYTNNKFAALRNNSALIFGGSATRSSTTRAAEYSNIVVSNNVLSNAQSDATHTGALLVYGNALLRNAVISGNISTDHEGSFRFMVYLLNAGRVVISNNVLGESVGSHDINTGLTYVADDDSRYVVTGNIFDDDNTTDLAMSGTTGGLLIQENNATGQRFTFTPANVTKVGIGGINLSTTTGGTGNIYNLVVGNNECPPIGCTVTILFQQTVTLHHNDTSQLSVGHMILNGAADATMNNTDTITFTSNGATMIETARQQ